MFISKALLAASIVLPQYVAANPCPFAALHEAGVLNDKEAAAFKVVRNDHSAAEALLKERDPQNSSPTISPDSGSQDRLLTGLIGPSGQLDLPLGGGLLNGVLQPLTGALADLDLPTPQAFYLKAIPGDDPDNQYQAPRPTDRRGICLTLDTLANHRYLSRDGITDFSE